MIRIAAVALVLSALTPTLYVDAQAKENVDLTVPLYLSCDGITGDQRILKILKITKTSISIWNEAHSKWGLLCGERVGACSINDKTISLVSENSIMSILRRTGQFETQLSNGATWMGACTETADPALSVNQTPPRP